MSTQISESRRVLFKERSRTLLRDYRSPGKALDSVPQSCTGHLAPTPCPAPDSCDYPKRWSILRLHSNVRNLVWQDFLPASSLWKGFLVLPSSRRAETCCSQLALKYPAVQGRSSAATTCSGWNKGDFMFVTSHSTTSPNLTFSGKPGLLSFDLGANTFLSSLPHFSFLFQLLGGTGM